jgi:tetratricopeptide (TPR) repeat protein
MFLRPENDNPEAQASLAALETRVQVLQVSLHPEPCLEDAEARLELAGILCWRGLYRETLDLIEPLATQPYPDSIQFAASQLIGDSHYRHDQYDLATKQYHICLEQAKRAGDEYWTARAEDGIAWVLIDVGHYTTGEFEEAGRIFESLIPIHRRRSKPHDEGMSLYGISRAAAGMGDYGRAIDFAHRSIQLLEQNEGHFLLQLPLLQLANVHRDRGAFDEAKSFYDLAIDAADRSQDPYLQVLVALNRGVLFQYDREFGAATNMWRSVLNIAKELEFPRLGH